MGKDIPVKISQATQEDITQMYRELHTFSMPFPRRYQFKTSETVFVAKKNEKILGFVKIFPHGEGKYEITGLYTRLGYDKQGIGSKLLGKANSFLIKVGAKHATIIPSFGKSVVNGKIVETRADGFYKTTNYKFSDPEHSIQQFEWTPARNPRIRKPKQKVSIGLSPQNRMNPLKLRRRK